MTNEQIAKLIPDGIVDANAINTRLTTTAISKLFGVDGMEASSYIYRLQREGRELSFVKEDSNNVHGFRNLYLVSDVLASAINDGLEITKPKSSVEKDIDRKLTLKQRRLIEDIERLQKLKDELSKDVRLMTGNLSDIAPILSQTKFSLVPKSDLIEKSLSYGDACGVYFLIKDKSIVYIGQSVNIANRVAQHRDKDFDSVSYVSCKKSELDILESLYILAYSPPLNGTAGGNGQNRPSTPISLQMIINKCKE